VSSAAGGGGRVLLAAGTKTYRHGADFGLENLERVPEALGWVVEALSGLGYEPQPTGARKYLLDPSLPELKAAVRAAAGAAPVVVVYYTGHGLKPDRRPYYLVTAGARPGPQLDDTALEASDLLDLVLRFDPYGGVAPDDEQPQVLIILDCCYSGAAGIEALTESLQGIGGPKVWVLASAGRLEEAQQGRFAAALKEVLLDLDPEMGSLQQNLPLDWVAEKINTALGQAKQRARYIPPGSESTGIPPFFPNPKYDPNLPNMAGLTLAEQQHWVSKLRGAPADTTTAGFYVTGHTGRFQVVQDLASWMRAPDRGGLAVVTGSAGCGKSAMLALPVLLTDQQHREHLLAEAAPGSLMARAADLFDDLPVVEVHARGMTSDQAAAAIAQSLDRWADSPEGLLVDLDDHPETSSRIVVIDAVDEAHNPQRLLTDLLVPLAHRPGLRVVIGARRQEARRQKVLPPAADTSLLIDLDTADYRDPQALADYAHQLLVAAHESDVASPYRDRDDDTVATVAAAIADRATERPTATREQQESFLLAQLLARAVRGRPQALDTGREGWEGQLPVDVGAAFDEDLARLGEREPIARALLAALAWAKGPGLPWARIWVPVAQALAAHSGTNARQPDHDDVRWLLDHAGAYIVEDLGPGQRSVFRPFHDLVAAHLRGQPSEDQLAADPAVEDAWQQRSQQVERAITRALLETVPTSPGKPNWELAHPYLRTYLAQHAHAAGPATFAELTADLDFLAVADPNVLTPLLTPTDPALRWVARPYRRARPLLGPSARDNAAYLQEAVVAETGSYPTGQRIRPTYRTVMARVRRDDSLLTLTFGGATVAFGADADGRPLLASGDYRTVRLWDPTTGAPVGDPLRGHSGPVNAVAFGVDSHGRPLLASGGEDGTVQLWDPTTGTPVGDPLHSHSGPVNAVAFGVDANGRPLLATGSYDRTVQLWDPTTGAPVGDPLRGHSDSVEAVAFGVDANGRPLLASGDFDGTVRLWDPTTGAPVGDPLHAHGFFSVGVGLPVEAVAFGVDANGRPLLASGGSDGTVRLWDPTTGAPVGDPLRGHSPVEAVAFVADAKGRQLLALVDPVAGGVRLWNPTTGDPVVTLVRRTTPAAIATHNTQLAIGDAEGLTVVEVMDPAG
jgi:WD domain, G-beta repeat